MTQRRKNRRRAEARRHVLGLSLWIVIGTAVTLVLPGGIWPAIAIGTAVGVIAYMITMNWGRWGNWLRRSGPGHDGWNADIGGIDSL